MTSPTPPGRSSEGPPLGEVAETSATGDTALLYADIREVTGAPMVNLVYRHLAARGHLAPVWSFLRPLFAAGAVERAARNLAPPAQPLERDEVAAAVRDVGGFGVDAQGALASTMAAYERANRMNLVAFSALRGGGGSSPAVSPSRIWLLPPWPQALPPAVDVSTADPETMDLLRRLGGSEPGAGAFIPTLYRHLAHWPNVLRVVCRLMEPHHDDGTVRRAAAALRADAATLTAPLRAEESSAPSIPPGVLTVLDTFCGRIAEMLVTIRLLKHLADPLPCPTR